MSFEYKQIINIYIHMEFIYFMHTIPYDGYIKIGKTKVSTKRRLSNLNTGNRIDLYVYKDIYVPVALNLESRVHKLLDDRRDKREWFRLELHEVDNLVEILTFNHTIYTGNVIDKEVIDLALDGIVKEEEDDEDEEDNEIDEIDENDENETKPVKEIIKKFQCPNCLEKFQFKSYYERHIFSTRTCKKVKVDKEGNIISTKKYQCENCGTSFTKNNNLTRHKTTWCKKSN